MDKKKNKWVVWWRWQSRSSKIKYVVSWLTLLVLFAILVDQLAWHWVVH